MNKILLSILFVSGSVILGFGQTSYSVNAEGSTVTIQGTSTVKKWDADVPDFTGTFTVDQAANEIRDIEITFTTSTIDGGRGPEMNNKIYKALQSETHPEITFVADTAKPGDEGYIAEGKLTIGGIEQEVSATGTLDGETLTGKANVTLSQFEIEPPSAMFGAIVCRDDITIEWTLNLTQKVN